MFSYAVSSSSYIACSVPQRLEWEKVVAKHPPCKVLTMNDLPQPGKTVPHRLYGWPFTEDYMLDYARRHRLVFTVSPRHRIRFGGKDQYNYGDLTDEDLADEKLVLCLRRRAILDVRLHFLRDGGAIDLQISSLVSQEWPWMFVLWSTRDYEQKYATYQMFGCWETVEKFIDNALNECLPEGCDRRTSLEWWWSREN